MVLENDLKKAFYNSGIKNCNLIQPVPLKYENPYISLYQTHCNNMVNIINKILWK